MSETPVGTAVPSVSVIIPVYNDAARLRLCLEALERQTYPKDRYEVVVVDNGSENGEEIAEACQAVAQARYLHEPKSGSYAARNKGIACTSSEIVAFTDSDCVPHRDWLEKGVTHLTEAPERGLVGGNVIVFFKDATRKTAAELYESAFAFPQRRRIESSHWSVTANLFTHRHVIDEVGPFNDRLRSGGDAEWGKRVHNAGYRLVYADDARIDHPARASLRDLLTKSARVAGGGHSKMLQKNTRYFLRHFVRSVYYSFRKSLIILVQGAYEVPTTRRFTLSERVKIAIVLNLVTGARLAEQVKLRLTGGQVRRS